MKNPMKLINKQINKSVTFLTSFAFACCFIDRNGAAVTARSLFEWGTFDMFKKRGNVYTLQKRVDAIDMFR
ncbi:hypothetical protein CO704_22295 [Cedecea neteri]|uniref:Uncharacterized protein n=1 Tax=Cedecea neteri TaxID=158822 RepID=A0A291E3W9_9ENTR|nr:hypothetical protein CO704_22295 [Cedecea neteri]